MPPKGKVAPVAAAPSGADQILGQKEQTLFKQVLRFYETKQYKKALKSADAILKKNPNHGETLAMKGLTYNNMKRRDEAYELVNKGLRMNLKSHVCWHVMGLLYRSESKYEQAIKAYQNALKQDTNNLQILKDLSNLQVQRRMLDGFTESRRRILQLKSNNKLNWIAYAIGNQLVSNHTKALQILDALSNTSDLGQRAANDRRPVTFEESEMHLYRAMLLEESGQTAECITYLADKQHEILDKLFALEKRAQLHLKLGQNAEAEGLYRKLIGMNPENYAYQLGLQKSLGFVDPKNPATKSFLGITYTKEQSESLLKFYETDPLFTSTKDIQKANVLKRLPLDFTQGDSFKSLITRYLKEKLTKGIPSLFSDLEPLYDSAEKAKVISGIIDEFVQNLRAENKFDKADAKDSESPSSLMYALYYAAQHYDHLGESDRALSLIDEAIVHTTTSPDNYMLKARILKHAGDPISAYAWMEIARRLDTQDRYLNTKCVRYALRADQLKPAEDTITLFLRDGDGLKALDDLQVCWYANNAADLHIRAKQYGRALKKLRSIDKHFTDMYEDQFDFHTYCLRKSTLRAYVDMIRWADTMRGHRYHVRAALSLVRVYLRLYDAPREEAQELDALAVEQNMTDEEKKEHQRKLKRAQAKIRQAEEKKAEKEAAEKALANKGKPQKDIDPDPEGAELLKAEPLAEATKYLLFLARDNGADLEPHTLGVQVYLRKEKYLLALRHVKRALAIDAAHPDAHFALCTFLHAVRRDGVLDKLNPLVKEVLEKEIQSYAPVATLNSAYLAQHSASIPRRLAVARVMLAIDAAGARAEAIKIASKLEAGESFKRKEAAESLTFLQETVKAPADVIQAFQATALKRFPLAVCFGATPKIPKAIDAE